MKIIVYEYVSGGGFAEKPIPQDVLSEGFGMLRGVVADFKAAGHEVTVLMDERITKLRPPNEAFCILPIRYAKEAERFLSRVATINDAVYVIAPETAGILQSLVEIVEKTGTASLNCESSSIKLAADKVILDDFLEKNGFPTPKTVVIKNSESLIRIKQIIKRELAFPMVVKPVDGVGCGGLSILRNETQVEKAIAKVKTQSANERFIAQEYISGESASVSLLSDGKKAHALSLNRQNVTLAEPHESSSYDGGCVPFEHPLKHKAFALATKVVESLGGLRGYVGVDLVLGEKAIFVLDVNPRLTTSYVGLREVAGFNVAEGLIGSVMKGKLPAKNESEGFACFSKIETSKPSVDEFQKAAKLDTVVSPPFPLEDNTKSSALVIGEGENLDDARLHLEEAKKNLLNIIT